MEKLLIGAFGVIIGAAITWVKELWSEHRKRKTESTYIAIRCISILEKFFDGCVDVALGQEYTDQQGCRQTNIEAPVICFDALSVNWNALPFQTLYSILSFPDEVKQAEALIDSICEHVAGAPDYDEYHTARHLEYSTLGLAAFELASNLRQQYKMPIKTFKHWDPLERLREQQVKTERNNLQNTSSPNTATETNKAN